MATRICVFIGFLVACSMERLGENLEWSDSNSERKVVRECFLHQEGIKDVRERERGEYWKERYKIGGGGREEKKERVLYAENRGWNEVGGGRRAVKWPSQRDRNRAARKSGCK